MSTPLAWGIVATATGDATGTGTEPLLGGCCPCSALAQHTSGDVTVGQSACFAAQHAMRACALDRQPAHWTANEPM
jgi:hypothetical protein